MRTSVRIRLALTIAATVGLVSGCATEGTRPACPALVAYPAEMQRRVADEMDAAVKVGAAWPRLIEDYGDLRARCRAIAAR